jgi:transposase-like protein
MKKKKQPIISKEQALEFTQNTAQLLSVGYKTIMWADDARIPQLMGYDSLRDWVTKELGGYLRYPAEERQKIVQELHANGKNKSEISNALGINFNTVSADLGQDPRAKNRAKNLEKQESSKPPPGWDDPPKLSKADREAENRTAAEEGLRDIVWDKVRDLFIPFWMEMLERLEADERSYLLEAINHHIKEIHTHETT